MEAAPIIREFVWITNGVRDGVEIGDGWRPRLIPAFDPGTPLHVAHDSIEHASDSDDSLEAEMRAAGAILFTRGEGDFWKVRFADDPFVMIFHPHKVTSAYGVGYDMLMFLANDERTLAAPTGPIPKVSAKGEEALNEIYEIGKNGPSERTKPQSSQPWKERVKIALDWARIGFNEQKERIGTLTPEERVGLFMGIEDTSLEVTRKVSHKLVKGDVMRVVIDPTKKKFDIVVKKGEEVISQAHERIHAATGYARARSFFQ